MNTLSKTTSQIQQNKLTTQPLATIIRKPSPNNTVVMSNDAANNAVNQINNNKALTVTSKRVAVTSDTTNRSLTAATLSAAPNVLTAINRTGNLQSKSNSSTPISISRAQLSPSSVANNKTSQSQRFTNDSNHNRKPNILSSRNTNAVKSLPNSVKGADPPSISVIPRTVDSNSTSEVLVSTKTQSRPTKPASISIQKISTTPIQRTSSNVVVNPKMMQSSKPGPLSKKVGIPQSNNPDKRANNNISSNTPSKRPRLSLNNTSTIPVSIKNFYYFNFTYYIFISSPFY